MTPKRFSRKELSALAVVTAECAQRGACALTLDAIAALAEVSRTTVRNTLRKARGLGLLEVEERRQFAAPNLASVVTLAPPVTSQRPRRVAPHASHPEKSPAHGGASVYVP
jgi:hypothetical protein